MNIDKNKLKIGIWYEDKDGNVIPGMDDIPEPIMKTGVETYHTCFPLQITEHIFTYHDAKKKAKCKHPRKYREKIGGFVKGFKGRKCNCCGSEQVRKSWQPWGRKWDNGTNITPLIDLHTSIGGGNEDVILAMANSGDFTLSEAIIVFANSCERCMNVLAYKYLDGKDGYPEFSEEWEKCNTVCDFCREDMEE